MEFHAQSGTYLQTVLKELRSQLLKRLSLNMPKGYSALTPVIFYKADPYTRCLYNFLAVENDAYILGKLVKGALRDIIDATQDLVGETDDQRIQMLHDQSRQYIRQKIDRKFDDYLLFTSEFDQGDSFIEFDCDVAELFVCDRSGSALLGERVSHLDLSGTLRKLHGLNRTRYAAFHELIDLLIQLEESRNNDNAADFIVNHPYISPESQNDHSRAQWQELINEVRAYSPQKQYSDPSVYLSLIKKTCIALSGIPFETCSSSILGALKNISSEEYLCRSDVNNINISDISLFRKTVRHKAPEEDQNILSTLSCHYEKLFLNPLKLGQDSMDSHYELVIPIKIFDFQVVGMMIIMTPAPLDKQLLLNTVQSSLFQIREAAKADFENDVFIKAFNKDQFRVKGFFDELEILCQSLHGIVSFRYLAAHRKIGVNWKQSLQTESCLSPLGHEMLRVSVVPDVNAAESDPLLRHITSVVDSRKDTHCCFTLGCSEMWQHIDKGAKSALVLVFGSENRRDLLLFLFEEEEELLCNSIQDLFLTIRQAYVKLKLIRERHEADLLMAQVTHDARKTNLRVSGELIELRNNLLNNVATIDCVDRALQEANDYFDLLEFLHGGSVYSVAEETPYRLGEMIRGYWDYSINKQYYIGLIEEKISSNANVAHLEAFRKAFNSGRISLDIFDADVEVTLNKRAIRYIISGLIRNALEHTDWVMFDECLCTTVIIRIIRSNGKHLLSFANIPRGDSRISPGTDASQYTSVNLSVINKALRAITSKDNNLRFEAVSYDNIPYLSVEMDIYEQGAIL